MNKELMEGMGMTVPIVGDVDVIAETMEAYDSEKQLVIIDEEERKELATILTMKGGMAGIEKKAKEFGERIKEVGSPWMLARSIKTVKVPGIGTLSLTEGTNVSISQDTLRKVLVNYVPADKVGEILEKVVKKTTYTTLQFKTETPK